MPQYQEPPAYGAQVFDIDAAIKDGILGDPTLSFPADDAAKQQPADLRRIMAELDAASVAQEEEAVPAVFICPISLEPMLDPVTLCTGQTYDRANISRWLALGRRTCPTTMQELWDDTLTPNATLRHLIAAWFSRLYAGFKKRSADFDGRAADLVHALRGSKVRSPLKGQARVAALREIRAIAASHPYAAKAIGEAGGVALLTSLLGPFTSHAVGSEAVAILVSGVALDADAKAALMQPARVSLVVDMLNEGAVDTKINCVRFIRVLMDERGFRPEMVASLSLLVGVMRLVRDKRHPDGVAAGLELLSSICTMHPPARGMVISIGAVPQLVGLLPELGTECVESALSILDVLAILPEGRTALKDCPRMVTNAVRLLMRVSEACTGRALRLLWMVCQWTPEESAPVAVKAGLAAKLLLVLQSACAPELKQQASELLKLLISNSELIRNSGQSNDEAQQACHRIGSSFMADLSKH